MKAENEGFEQAALLEWAEFNAGRYPELKLLFHIPNGGLRSKTEAARMKRQGVKAGVPDLCLPVARGKWHGLFIELKATGGRASAAQKEWIAALTAQGYRAEVCFGWGQAADVIKGYLLTQPDGKRTENPVCEFCGREIDGIMLRGKKLGEVMTCTDCAETIVKPALKKRGLEI